MSYALQSHYAFQEISACLQETCAFRKKLNASQSPSAFRKPCKIISRSHNQLQRHSLLHSYKTKKVAPEITKHVNCFHESRNMNGQDHPWSAQKCALKRSPGVCGQWIREAQWQILASRQCSHRRFVNPLHRSRKLPPRELLHIVLS